uniref:Transmembrane protein 194A n=1 Tax=Steinernema glaseri TaxID=37863 RepID=A0A1I7ZGW4_9BILA
MEESKAEPTEPDEKLIEPYQATLLLGSVFLFLYARRLVRSTAFYYILGCLAGVFSGVVILVYVLSKLIPMGLSTATKGTVLIGYAFSSYILYSVCGYVWSLVVAYQTYFMYYVCASAGVGLLLFYWYGPPTDPRKLDAMQWTLQLISTLTIYLCTPDHYVSILIIVVLILIGFVRGHLLPSIVKAHGKINRIRNKWFPTPRKLLTQEEYEREGEEFTRRELELLRQAYRSPDVMSYKVFARCKNPRKLARFVEGIDDHITELEASEYSHYWEDDEPVDKSRLRTPEHNHYEQDFRHGWDD